MNTTIATGVTLSAIRIVHEHTNRGDGDTGIYRSHDFKMPVFVGKNWVSFKNKFEGFARARGWNDRIKASSLYSSIQNDAADALGEADSINWSYDRLVAHMERRHGRNKAWGMYYRKPGVSGVALDKQCPRSINLLNQANLGEDHFREQADLTYQAYRHQISIQDGSCASVS